MKLSTHSNSTRNNTGESILTTPGQYPARVADIILDETHPEYFKYGGPLSIGAIKFTPVDRQVDNSDTSYLGVAFPLNPQFKSFPLVNEIVLLINAPSYANSIGRSSESVQYYTTIVGLWNSTTNASPDNTVDDRDVDLGYEYEDRFIKPLHPFHGDTIIQGRNGQSIRLSGARSFKNSLTTKENSGDPITILSNGYVSNGEEGEFHVENINEDKSSIYLASNHLLPLEIPRDKYAGATERPVLPSNYIGNQIILNSDRIVINAKTDDILISANNNLGITSKTVFLDGETSIGLDATKIYLGEKAVRFELEPIVLGNQLELFLDVLLNELLRVANAFKRAKTVDGKVIPTLLSEGFTLEAVVKQLQNRINPNGSSQLKSKKVFTE